jgi:valyl-tRNA synthetase
MKELPKQYNPKESEANIYKLWEEQGLFHAEVYPEKKPYTIVIPPPNITGILHMGHALNNTIQDILIRYKKMKGFEALWMPGTDHAGIATQNVVERKLAKEGKKRHDIGREKFIEEIWKWQKEYGGTIIKQLRRLGAACDWSRERFTMDEGLSDAVVDVFVRLYKKGLIYRGNYIINWCPRCQTALSDEEAEHRELDGNLYYIRYALKKEKGTPRLCSGQESKKEKLGASDCRVAGAPRNDEDDNYVTIATTRPETMLGDTALAVNPDDERYKALIGQTVILPIINREIKIIADDMVDPEFGTGVVKITPAHDPNDFLMGRKHGLEEINIMKPDGVLNENAGEFEGMDRFEARVALVELLQEKKLIEKIMPHKHAVGHCYRCHTIVEPYLSKQWFVKMKPLAGPAIEAVEKGNIKFYPERWKKVYLDWMYNIRDWCISRQIWWGHRLPVYYCRNCTSSSLRATEESEAILSRIKSSDCFVAGAPRNDKGIIISKTKPEKCPECGGTDIVQDPDVLDTWFSSWLWPFSIFGWPFLLTDTAEAQTENRKPKTEFEYFYPTSTLVTAQEIIFFWVARMIMAGLEFCGDIPFKDVYIHGTVRDDTGTKMSKSLGNTIDPIEIIEQYGADALRFSIISITAVGQDVFLSRDRFESGRNFANKLWNVSRFLLMNLDSSSCGVRTAGNSVDESIVIPDYKGLSLADKWILSSFYQALGNIEKALADYRFNDAANIIYDFIWHKYCDWYVEIAKASIDNNITQAVLFKVLTGSLKMLHPFMPFVTEAIWQQIGMKDTVMSSRWPDLGECKIDKHAIENMEKIIKVMVSIRNIRAEMGIAHKQAVSAIISTEDKGIISIKEELCRYAERLASTVDVKIEKTNQRPKLCASNVLDFCEIFIPLEGIIDIDKERQRLDKALSEAEKFLSAINKKLMNKAFIGRAPENIVQDEKQKALAQKDKIARIRENLKNLA